MPIRYAHQIVPQVPAQLPRYLDTEFRRIKAAFDQVTDSRAETLLVGYELADQSPTGLGDAGKIQLKFGAPQMTPQDPVQLLADGSIVFNRADQYELDVRLVFQRTTQPGDALLFVRGLINGVQFGNPVAVSMLEADVAVPQQMFLTSAIPQGAIVTLELARDPAGVNDGLLSTLASTMGWGTAPSSVIRIARA